MEKRAVILDEIGDASLELQAKLLRTLEEKSVRRVGGAEEIPIRVSIVVATNKDLPAMIRQGNFGSAGIPCPGTKRLRGDGPGHIGAAAISRISSNNRKAVADKDGIIGFVSVSGDEPVLRSPHKADVDHIFVRKSNAANERDG